MLLRIHPSLVLLVLWTYCALFITLGSTEIRYSRYADIGSGGDNDSCTACIVGTFADNATGDCNCSCTCTPTLSTVKPCNCSGYCTDNSSCKECDFGHHSNKTGSILCLECDMGYYANATGSINCTACPKGTYVNYTKAEVCSNCPLGTHAEQTGQAKCLECRKGTYCNETDKTGSGCVLCSSCPAGFVAPYDGTVNCSACARGKYMPHDGGVKCLQCDITQGQVCTSNDFCINCGHCLPGQGPSSAYSCVSCKAGQYSNEKTTHMCRECPSGYYQVYQGMSHCIQCPEGSYCPYPSSEPMLCPHGSHCPNGSMQPVYCTNNLLEYDSKTQACAPTPALIGIIICIFVVFVLLVVLTVLVVYWSYCRKKEVPVEKLPLYQHTPVKNPQYGGL
ncbi:signal peptide, CUB and EGF-like domain-containing protein 2 [Halichondria panicea]|uniref:signal peptide, CUB and EGF-like domain-containing protein 2 n=1 Tax=Halichondria panicea TaxID=6063 RepID=UPI00312B4E8C